MADRRTEEEIRRQIGTERELLEASLSDLRRGVAAKRRPLGIVGAALLALLASAVVRRILRLFRRG